MTSNKTRIIMIAGLLALAAAVLVVGLQVRNRQLALEQAGAVRLVVSGREIVIPFSRLDRNGFSGETVNGKGERAADDYRGIEMSALLREYDIDPARVTGMVVTASDQYSAEYTGDEIREPGKVFLATRRNGKEIEGIGPGRTGIWVIVFGDSDSRRLVRNPDRIHINSPEGSTFREED